MNLLKQYAFAMAVALIAVACQTSTKKQEQTQAMASITKESFGTVDNQPIDLYTLTNANGMTMKVTNYGCLITHLTAPDKDGNFEDVVLGFDSLASYLKPNPFFGAIVGRYGNRIANGKFTLDGQTYTLATNNGPNHLHGGIKGFDKKIWKAEEFKTDSGVGLTLTYTSPDGEEGYPGNLATKIVYTLSNDNTVRVDYEATTDKPTVVNLCQHTYFNLTGGAKRDILDHELSLHGSQFVPVDKTLIPTGELASVTGTPFDFTKATAIGARINDTTDVQIKNGGGYDHCWVVDRKDSSMVTFATVVEPVSKRKLEVSTTEPGVQFYTGNFLDGSLTGKGGLVYKKRYGLCLETQHYPDSPNQPKFPSTVLRPGQTYKTSTIFKFSVAE
ncbi:MAG: aldose epimerase family protein [Spirosomataceae bacterium]